MHFAEDVGLICSVTNGSLKWDEELDVLLSLSQETDTWENCLKLQGNFVMFVTLLELKGLQLIESS